jgi:hypothetical protein
MVNRESLNAATTQSHDIRIQIIDDWESQLLTRIQKWANDYCDEIIT